MTLRASTLADLLTWAIRDRRVGITVTIQVAPGVWLAHELAPARN